MVNITEKLTRLRGSAITAPMPATMVGPRKYVPPKASRNWLTYMLTGRVWLVACASIRAPAAISSSANISERCSVFGLIVSALTTRPATLPSSTTMNRFCIWSVFKPSACRKPTAPVDSDSTMRNSSTDKNSLAILPVVSQRVLSSGRARLCSMASEAAISTMEHARHTPTHSDSIHHAVRPCASTAHSRATPGANRMKVRKSSGSNVCTRSPGGSFRASTQPSASRASPSSNRYRPCHSPICSSSEVKMRASGKASWAKPRPSTTPFRRCRAGNACKV